MNIDVNKLRNTTEAARLANQQRQLADAEARRIKAEARAAVEESEAKSIVVSAAERCNSAAKVGEDFVRIYSTKSKSGEIVAAGPLAEPGMFPKETTDGQKIMVCRKLFLVCEELTAQGLKMEFTDNHDGVGVESWYELWVSW
jgi:hypothetical protein